MSAKSDIQHGNNFPFDAPDAWWEQDGEAPPAPKDWAHSAARGIIANLQDRRGIKHELARGNIDEEVRAEIVDTLASIIREANDQEPATEMKTPKTPKANSGSCSVNRLVRPHAFIAPRGWAEPDGEYRSRFNFVWWFWLPRIHTQRPDTMNPRVIRLIWLCFAVGLDIYGPESRMYWPND